MQIVSLFSVIRKREGGKHLCLNFVQLPLLFFIIRDKKRMRNMFLFSCAQRNVLLSSRSTMETATTRIVKLVVSPSPQFRENDNEVKERESERTRLLSFILCTVYKTNQYIFDTYENKIVFDKLTRSSLIQKKGTNPLLARTFFSIIQTRLALYCCISARVTRARDEER